MKMKITITGQKVQGVGYRPYLAEPFTRIQVPSWKKSKVSSHGLQSSSTRSSGYKGDQGPVRNALTLTDGEYADAEFRRFLKEKHQYKDFDEFCQRRKNLDNASLTT